MSLVKLASLSIGKLKDIYPSLKPNCLEILKELVTSIQSIIQTNFDKALKNERYEFEVLTSCCIKYVQLISSISLIHFTDGS